MAGGNGTNRHRAAGPLVGDAAPQDGVEPGDTPIAHGAHVRLRLRLYDSQGEALEEGERETSYRHGVGDDIFEEIEQALEGLRAGDRASVYLEPEQSFGEYDASLMRLAPREAFPADLEPGMTFEGLPGDEEEDDRIWTVTAVDGDTVVVDANHPLAGMALRFDLLVVDVQEPDAVDEEDDGDPDDGRGGSGA